MASNAEPTRKRKKSRGRNGNVAGDDDGMTYRFEKTKQRAKQRATHARKTSKADSRLLYLFCSEQAGPVVRYFFGAGFLPLDFFLAAMVDSIE
jgi:hypothetical protein